MKKAMQGEPMSFLQEQKNNWDYLLIIQIVMGPKKGSGDIKVCREMFWLRDKTWEIPR